MNSEQAKRILLAWHPDNAPPHDPEIAEALAHCERDPELQAWLHRHRAFQGSMRRAFQEVPVPPGLANQIRAAVVPLQPRASRLRRRKLLGLAAAAALAFLVGALALWWRPVHEDSFAIFRTRMISRVLRQYTMDLTTNDMTVIRRHQAAGNAPSDYPLPPRLAALPVLGAGLLSWQDRKVAMVCFNSTNNGTLFFFVVDREAVGNPPASMPEFAPVNQLMTASWSQGNRTFVLALRGQKEDLRKYL